MGRTGDTRTIVHGTAVALGDRAALLRGASGRGKSDLALRAIGLPTSRFLESPIELVADDQVVVCRQGQQLMVSPPAGLEGLIEVRGLGVMTVPHRPSARLSVLVDLVEARSVERMPDPWPVDALLGVSLPVMRLAAFEAAAPLKLALALTAEPWQGPKT